MQPLTTSGVRYCRRSYFKKKNMKIFSTYFVLTLTILTTNEISAQQLKCIICPEQLGIVNVESGASIASLAPIKATHLDNFEEKSIKATVIEENEEGILGFGMRQEDPISEADMVPTSDDGLCGDPTECGLISEEEMALAQKTFKLYPNPAHHWVVINKEALGEDDFKIFVKDAQGNAITDFMMTTDTKTLNLRNFAQGVYFVTLRNEATYTEWVQKISVK